jgi:hypothetical protein
MTPRLGGMTTHPDSDLAFLRLHRAGWTVGEVAVLSPEGIRWVVTGNNGENRIEARGRTQDEAWSLAVVQAEAVGMAGGVTQGKAVGVFQPSDHFFRRRTSIHPRFPWPCGL